MRFKSKYGNTKLDTPDGKFDSKKEYKRWGELKLLEKAGEITNLQRQITYLLAVNGTPIAKYISDFEYMENGKRIVEDVKGYRAGTAYTIFRMKKKLMYAIFKITIKET